MIAYIRSLDPRGVLAGVLVMAVLAMGIILGSRTLRNYDPVLLTYTFGILFSAFAVAYRYAVWLQRPPTATYARRGWELFRKGNPFRNLLFVLRAAAVTMGEQRFIRKRSFVRWLIHFSIAWGCLLAAAVTFPLVFGWLRFVSALDDPSTYRILLFDVPVGHFSTQGFLRYVMFNLLNVSAVLVIVGAGLSLRRRLRDPMALSRQQFGNDIVPLLLLLAISLTGLMLTFSSHALGGAGYTPLSLVHAMTVSATLLYIPFGKFFHIFQRPLHLAAILYRRESEADPATCTRCGAAFGGNRHVRDLRVVLRRNRFALDLTVCPPCKRKSLGLAQAAAKGRGVLS
jgi:hypothetical protein